MLELALPALLPILTDTVSRVVRKYTAGENETLSAEDQISILEAEAKKLMALASLDNSSNTSLWVNNLRGAMRPLVAIGVISAYVGLGFSDNVVAMSDMRDFAVMVGFYLFGERTLNKLHKN